MGGQCRIALQGAVQPERSVGDSDGARQTRATHEGELPWLKRRYAKLSGCTTTRCHETGTGSSDHL
jgi:hypothetical protein